MQTLHRKTFDHGTVLHQTPYPGIEHNSHSVEDLRKLTAQEGAEMLRQCIQRRTFVPPLQDVGWYQGKESATQPRPAPKITTEDRHIDWQTWSAAKILRRQQIIGPLWNTIDSPSQGQSRPKRIIWANGFKRVPQDVPHSLRPGCPVIAGVPSDIQQVLVPTCDRQVLAIKEIKIEGEVETKALTAMSRLGCITPLHEHNEGLSETHPSKLPLR